MFLIERFFKEPLSDAEKEQVRFLLRTVLRVVIAAALAAITVTVISNVLG